uniref:Uncharacterized protein n=1 Tax=Anguilla anguilla TaxID=7936 RepID=A0A0E9PF60_ANGAN
MIDEWHIIAYVNVYYSQQDESAVSIMQILVPPEVHI